MINIRVKHSKNDDLLSPIKMIGSEYDTVYQQYSNDKPQKDFYISCGYGETSVIHIWYDEESKIYRFSTDDSESLNELASHVKVKEIQAEVNLEIDIN